MFDEQLAILRLFACALKVDHRNRKEVTEGQFRLMRNMPRAEPCPCGKSGSKREVRKCRRATGKRLTSAASSLSVSKTKKLSLLPMVNLCRQKVVKLPTACQKNDTYGSSSGRASIVVAIQEGPGGTGLIAWTATALIRNRMLFLAVQPVIS